MRQLLDSHGHILDSGKLIGFGEGGTLEPGKELFIDAADAEPNEKMQFRFDVAIHEPGLIEGGPIVETVVGFRDRISDIVNAFKPCLV